MQSHLARLVTITVGVSVQLLWLTSAAAHGVTLKVHHPLPEDSAFHTQFVVPWTQKLEKESHGLLRFQLFPAMKLGGTPAQLYHQVVDGTAHIVWTAIGNTPGRFPAAEIFELPFMTKSARGASRALWEYARLNDLGEKEFEDVRLLAMHVSDSVQLHMVNKPVKSFTDLQGLKIGVLSPATSKLLSGSGAVPMEMPISQLSEALSKGQLVGALLPWTAIPVLKLDDMVKHHTETLPMSPSMQASVFVLAMNRGSYKTLSDELKALITANSGAEVSARIGRIFDEAAASARKLSSDRGNSINVLTVEDLASLQKSAQNIAEDMAQRLTKRGLRGKDLLQSAGDLLDEHDKPN